MLTQAHRKGPQLTKNGLVTSGVLLEDRHRTVTEAGLFSTEGSLPGGYACMTWPVRRGDICVALDGPVHAPVTADRTSARTRPGSDRHSRGTCPSRGVALPRSKQTCLPIVPLGTYEEVGRASRCDPNHGLDCARWWPWPLRAGNWEGTPLRVTDQFLAHDATAARGSAMQGGLEHTYPPPPRFLAPADRG